MDCLGGKCTLDDILMTFVINLVTRNFFEFRYEHWNAESDSFIFIVIYASQLEVKNTLLDEFIVLKGKTHNWMI